MPAQTAAAKVVHYVEGDTLPALQTVILDEDTGEPEDLSIFTAVYLSIAHARWNYYYGPTKRIVDESPGTIDPDQVSNPGLVFWSPADETVLTPPGLYHYSWRLETAGGKYQSYPTKTYLPMRILTPVGGQALHRGNP